MLSKIHQRLWEAGQGLAGDGMLLRLRNASIALVGAVAAVGLGLTLFISQLGFPAVVSGPIPDGPAQRGSVHDAIALHQGPAFGPSSPALSTGTDAAAPRRPRHAGQAGGVNSGGVSGGGSHQIAVSPGAQSGPAGPQHVASAPVSTPAAPAAEPPPPAPSPAPVQSTVESPSKSGLGGQSQGGSDGKSTSNGPATAKVTSDGKSKSGPSSKGPKVSKSDGNTVSGGKSNDSAAEKARHDQSAAAPSPVAPPAPAPSAAKPAPEATSPAAAKEAADSGR